MWMELAGTSLAGAGLWAGLWYAAAGWAARQSGRWPDSPRAWENSPHWAACCIVSTANAILSAAVCLPAALALLGAPGQIQFISTTSMPLCIGQPSEPGWQLAYQEGWGAILSAVALAGQSFTIRTGVDLVLQARHRLLTAEEAVHHLIFIAAGCMIRGHCMLPLNAALLMAMEVSTPCLNWYVYFRARYPYSWHVNRARLMFVVSFLLFRVGLNTYGAVLFLLQFPEAMPDSVPGWQKWTMLGVVMAGAAQQWFWGIRLFMRSRHEKAKERVD